MGRLEQPHLLMLMTSTPDLSSVSIESVGITGKEPLQTDGHVALGRSLPPGYYPYPQASIPQPRVVSREPSPAESQDPRKRANVFDDSLACNDTIVVTRR